MYHGKTTPELKELYEQYEKKFGMTAWGYLQLDYGQEDYSDFVRDIKKAIETGKELPDFVE